MLFWTSNTGSNEPRVLPYLTPYPTLVHTFMPSALAEVLTVFRDFCNPPLRPNSTLVHTCMPRAGAPTEARLGLQA